MKNYPIPNNTLATS